MASAAPTSSAGASRPEGEGCHSGGDSTGRGGCVDGGSAGGSRVGDNNYNGRCRQHQTTNNNQHRGWGQSRVWHWQRQRCRCGGSDNNGDNSGGGRDTAMTAAAQAMAAVVATGAVPARQ